MGLASWLEDVASAPRPEDFEHLRSEIGIDWVREALSRTGKQTIRRRVLPNEVVVWLVVGMALFRDRCIEAVVKHLGLPTGRSKWGRTRSPRHASDWAPTPSRRCFACVRTSGLPRWMTHDVGGG